MRTRKIRQISRIAKRLSSWYKSLEFKSSQKVERETINNFLSQIYVRLGGIEDIITTMNSLNEKEKHDNECDENGTLQPEETCELAEAVKKQLAHERHPF